MSVLQTRRERISAATPSMSIDVITPLGSQEVRVQITNHGPAARGVEFAVAVDGQMAYGHPPPSPSFMQGETRTLLTGIRHLSDTDPVGFVSCYELTGSILHVWWPSGEHRSYHARDRPNERPSRVELMQQVAPGFDISQVTLVRYQRVEG